MNDHEVAKFLAQRAGDLLVGIRSGSDNQGTKEIAALADIAAHDLLMNLIADLRPHDCILSEEGADEKSRLTAQRLWIIDPLDGSANYAKGDPGFAIQIALWERDRGITAAAVYVPAQNRMLSTQDEVPQRSATQEIRVIVSNSRPPKNLTEITARLSEISGLKVKTLQWGSVGAKLERIVSGVADVYVNTDGFFEWDIAAPLGVAQHYGYCVTDMHGKPIELNKTDVRVENAVICHPKFVQAVIESLA